MRCRLFILYDCVAVQRLPFHSGHMDARRFSVSSGAVHAIWKCWRLIIMHCHDHNQSVCITTTHFFSLANSFHHLNLQLAPVFIFYFFIRQFCCWNKCGAKILYNALELKHFFVSFLFRFDTDTLWLHIIVHMREFINATGSLQWLLSVGCLPTECSCQLYSQFGVCFNLFIFIPLPLPFPPLNLSVCQWF